MRPALSFFLICAFLLAFLPESSAEAITSRTILNADFETLELREADRILVSGTQSQAGSVYRYPNVITVDGVTVYALLTIESLGPCTLTEFAHSNEPAFAAYLSPRISCTSTGVMTYRIDFFDTETDDPVAIGGFLVTGFDLDGTAANREIHEHIGFDAYELDLSTDLIVSQQPDGYTRFLGPTTSIDPDEFEDTGTYVLSYENPVSGLRFRMGAQRSGGTAQARFHYLAFGRIDDFTNPVETTAPQVTLSTVSLEVADPFVVNATFSRAVSGLTLDDFVVDGGTAVGPLLVSADGLTYTFTVDPDAGTSLVGVQLPAASATSASSPTLPNAASNILLVAVACPVGSYDGGAGTCLTCPGVDDCIGVITCTDGTDSVCTLCQPGFFVNSLGTCSQCTGVDNCTGAVTCSTASDSICSECAAGFTGDQCAACLPGFFGPNCLPCTCVNGTCDDGIGGSGICDEGSCTTNWTGPNCDDCPAGSFDDGAGSCTTCTGVDNCTGAVTCSTASDSICSECAAGFTGDQCAACLPGFFGPNCLPCTCVNGTCDDGIGGSGICDQGSCTTNWTGPNCDDCPAGSFDDGAGSCTTCTGVDNCTGAVTCSTASDSICSECAAGFTGDQCAACLPGFFGPNCLPCTCVNGTCDDGISGSGICDEGSCTTNWTGPNCDDCPAGSFDDGAGSCTTCTGVDNCTGAVTCSTASDSICSECAAGFTGDQCAACLPGFFGPNCLPCTCVNGTCDDGISGSGICDEGSCTTNWTGPNCDDCPAGSFDDGAGSCTTCTGVDNCTGAVTCSTASDSICSECAAGFTGDQCAACLPGFFGPNCLPCTCVNGTCDDGIGGSGICDEGSCTTNWTGPNCDNCPAGSFDDGAGSCTTCTGVDNCTGAVTCSTASDSICSECASGFTGDQCAACLPGFFGPNCLPCTCVNGTCDDGIGGSGICDEGSCTTNWTGPNCDNCPGGSFDDGAGSCTTCTGVPNCDGFVTCTTADDSVCDDCAPGFFADADGICVACTGVDNCTGAVTCTTASDSICSECAPGFTGDQCAACLPGFFGPNCLPCTCVNGTCDDGISGSGICDEGSCTTNWTGPNCDNCPAGSFDDGAGSCTTCTGVDNCTGAVTCTTASDSICSECAAGFTGDQCAACLPGFFGPNCLPCTCVNGTCDDGISGSGICDEGSCTTNWTGPNCDNCPAGSFDDGEGSCTSCTGVPNCDGFVTCTTADDSVCDDCAPGFFADADGICVACTAVPGCAGDVTCTDATDSQCSACADGFFLDAQGACVTCTEVANCDGAVTCTDADDSVCDACDEGFVGDQCDSCADGRFGAACLECTCENGTCDEGITGSGICLDCDLGWTGDDCDACATGYAGLFCDECDTHYERQEGVCAPIDYCGAAERNDCDGLASCTNDIETVRGYVCVCPASYADVNEDGTLCEATIQITSPVDGVRINDPQPEISGVGTPGATVVVTFNGEEVGTAEVDAQGTWSVTPSEPLDVGQNTVTAESTLDGVVTEDSIELYLNPGPPWIVILSPELGEVLTDSPEAIRGQSEPGAEVTVYLDGEVLGTVTADEAGDWELLLEEELADGVYEVEARASRGEGPTGVAESGFIIDRSVDVRILSPADGSTVRTNRPVVTGTAGPDAEVEIFVDGEPAGTATADGEGNWTWTPEASEALPEGEVTITATSGDSTDTIDIIVDTATTGVVITAPEDGALTNNPQPTVRGSAAPNREVRVSAGGQEATVVSDENGLWTWTPGTRLPEGEVTIRAVDLENQSEDEVTITIDTIPPALTIDTPTDGDEITGEDVVVSGTGEPGARIDVFIGGALVGTTVVDENGDWSVELDDDLPPGETEIVVVATDDAGNSSRDSVTVTVVEEDSTEPPTTEPPTTEPPTTEPPTTEPPTTEPPTTEPPTTEPPTTEPSEEEPMDGVLFGGGISCAAAPSGPPSAWMLLGLLGLLVLRRRR